MTAFDWLGKLLLYFRRGYATYISFPLSLMNMSIIGYNFAFKEMSFIPESFKHLWVFILIFFFTFIPISVIIGYYDIKKGTYKSEAKTAADNNPNWIKLFKELKEIKEKINE